MSQIKNGVLKFGPGNPFVVYNEGGERMMDVADLASGLKDGDEVTFEVVSAGQYRKVARVTGKAAKAQATKSEQAAPAVTTALTAQASSTTGACA